MMDVARAMSDDVEALTEVLKAHRQVNGFVSEVWRNYACSCGWWSTADQERDFDRHVAELLAARVAAARAEERERWAGEVRALADAWESIALGSGAAAAAREGLSDAHQLTDHSAMMHRRVAQLRALLPENRETTP